MENLMKLYAEKERCTDYFREYAITQIKMAHRLMEYLNPDSIFMPKDLSEKTMKLFLNKENKRAVIEIIENELNKVFVEINSSQGYENFVNEAVVLSYQLYEKYIARKYSEEIKERENLLKRLEELDKNILNKQQ